MATGVQLPVWQVAVAVPGVDAHGGRRFLALHENPCMGQHVLVMLPVAVALAIAVATPLQRLG